MSANAERGEVDIKLKGTEYILIPSFENLVTVEELAGGFMGIYKRIIEGDIRIKDFAALISGCAAPPIAYEEAQKMVVAEGMTNITAAMSLLVTAPFIGEEEYSKNLERLPEKPGAGSKKTQKKSPGEPS